MTDSTKSPNRTWEAIKEVIDPLDRISLSAARQQELDNADFAVGLEDKRAVLAEIRRKERSNIKQGELGLLEYDDQPEADMGDLHIGPKIEVRQLERPDNPQPTPQPRPANGLAKAAIGALAATGLLGAGGLGYYVISQLNKPDPPAKVQPVEPTPKYRFSIQ